MSSPADTLRKIWAEEENPKPKPTVPTIYFHVPPVTGADIVNNVFHNKGGWKTLQQVANETAEEERLRKLDEEFGRTPIPEPEF